MAVITKQELIDFECDGRCCALDKIYPKSEASLACDLDCYFSKKGEGRNYLVSYVKKNFKIFRECINYKNGGKKENS